MSVNLNFFLNWQEYFAAQEYFRRRRYNLAPEKVIGGVMMSLSAVWFILDDFNPFAVVSFVAGLAIIFCALAFRRWASKRRWEREPLFHSEHTISVSDAGVYFLMGKIESNLNWQYYQRFLESPDGFLLVYGNDSFNLLPKRAFDNEESMNEFRSLAAKRLTK